MNPKFLLIFSLGLLLVATMVTGKGGPLDQFANHPEATVKPIQPAPARAPSKPKSDFFSDWQATEPGNPADPAGMNVEGAAVSAPPASPWSGGPKTGELTKEQLGVEEITNP